MASSTPRGLPLQEDKRPPLRTNPSMSSMARTGVRCGHLGWGWPWSWMHKHLWLLYHLSKKKEIKCISPRIKHFRANLICHRKIGTRILSLSEMPNQLFGIHYKVKNPSKITITPSRTHVYIHTHTHTHTYTFIHEHTCVHIHSHTHGLLGT